MKFEDYSDQLRDWLMNHGVFGDKLYAIHLMTGLALLGALCFLTWFLTRLIIITFVKRAVTKTKTDWDDQLFEYKVFRTLALILIAIILVAAMPVVFRDFPITGKFALIFAKIYVVLSIMFSVNAILNAIVGILEKTDRYKDKPVRSYKQVTKIVFYIIGFVMILAIVLNQSPLYIFTGFGAVTAILLLIFRDPILGFVASVQMSAVDLIRIGDWITVEKYGADGEVMEINLTTIKVRNWDMTVTIVPSYAIVSESFKNWRGMEESEGRRIKRHINIKISSIRFCDENLYQRLLKIERIKDVLQERQNSIELYNAENSVDKSVIINGRQMTNIGIFRLYAEKFLEGNPLINKDMTFMVRQLQPNENGLPIEVYAFSIEKELEKFEGVAADIFDHLLAAVPYFDLEIFQSPSGSDMRAGLKKEDSSSPWHESL
ncbi:MAG: mechanosensitive ion channel family protein [Flavobacteriales bacterium]|nr:mechanosensitive ion channel family protein [Flavobacteriales bacterium]